MVEHSRELVDLKREVVETRNQAIKTDNQIKNLTLDMKAFEQRFDGLEQRVRLSGVGVNLIVALSMALAAWFVVNVRGRAYEGEIAQLKEAVHQEHLAAQVETETLQQKVDAEQALAKRHAEASQRAEKVMDLLQQRDDAQAAETLQTLHLADLSELEARLLTPRFDELRQRQAVVSWRQGRAFMLQQRPDEAVAPFRRVLTLDGNGRFGLPAKSQLGWALWQCKRYEEAEALLRPLIAQLEGTAQDDARYLWSVSLLRLGRREDGKKSLLQLLQGDSKFIAAAKAYLQALDTGSELPEDLPGGRVRVSRRLPGPQSATLPAGLPPAPPPGAVVRPAAPANP